MQTEMKGMPHLSKLNKQESNVTSNMLLNDLPASPLSNEQQL
jgi:hypothetical protein